MTARSDCGLYHTALWKFLRFACFHAPKNANMVDTYSLHCTSTHTASTTPHLEHSGLLQLASCLHDTRSGVPHTSSAGSTRAVKHQPPEDSSPHNCMRHVKGCKGCVCAPECVVYVCFCPHTNVSGFARRDLWFLCVHACCHLYLKVCVCVCVFTSSCWHWLPGNRRGDVYQAGSARAPHCSLCSQSGLQSRPQSGNQISNILKKFSQLDGL